MQQVALFQSTIKSNARLFMEFRKLHISKSVNFKISQEYQAF